LIFDSEANSHRDSQEILRAFWKAIVAEGWCISWKCNRLQVLWNRTTKLNL